MLKEKRGKEKMFDILCDIWKKTENTYSPVPIWSLDGKVTEDELVRQLDDFHKRGIDAVVISPEKKFICDIGYLSDSYFSLLEQLLEEAERRFMTIFFSADAARMGQNSFAVLGSSEKRAMARILYALPDTAKVPDDEDIAFKIFVKLENGKMTDIKLGEEQGYDGYYLVMGYKNGWAADFMNPSVTEMFVNASLEPYYSKLSRFFGKTVVGFFDKAPSCAVETDTARREIPWSYGFIEEFMEEGGEFTHLAALLFETENKKLCREAQHILACAVRRRIASSYGERVSKWCREHSVLHVGYPANISDCHLYRYFDVPGQYFDVSSDAKNEIYTDSMAGIKSAADCASHMGISRSAAVCPAEIFGNTPADTMRSLNSVFSFGCSTVVPDIISYSKEESNKDSYTAEMRADAKKTAAYIKRMSWLNGTGTNNPEAVVLCSEDYIPIRPVSHLVENGYSFNYLTIDDFMKKADVYDGRINIDRYSYNILLIDGRLRLDAEIVRKIGAFVTSGGIMHRGSDFIGTLKKHVKKTSYFEGEQNGNLRFTHLTKSGYDFFVMINTGDEKIVGKLVTDIPGEAFIFNPFNGSTEAKNASLCDGGFAYSADIAPNSALVIGINKDALPKIASDEEYEIVSITSLSENRMTFDFFKKEGRRAILMFNNLYSPCDVSVNGTGKTRIIYPPYELDITEYLSEGENSVSVIGEYSACTVRIYDKK